MDELEAILLRLCRQESLPDAAVLDMLAVQRERYPRASLLYWAVVDYGLPSTEPRFFVFDTLEGSVQRFLVAHGCGGNPDANRLLVGEFSDEPGSNATCLGVCRASDTFFGSHGLSLRLDGMETRNTHMRERNLAMYGADYVAPDYVREHGMPGCSDGSLALDPQYSVGLINMLQGGSYINCICSRPAAR
ncbi:murein L,D-transpeptidase catalytic domain-containing protein [Chromobacterium amazonense]|uniref:murein L,D-transpeptidase catalytic domain-containing protein n=1 Tax=Chromobacterium amazonense TaxID=1382803 RepID=UPI00237D3C10|nr:murein L,D-transpeptidase catalytic domain family protein [Chromobacterium amazonense]MDE1712669.1 murein L,D-transpeptidase catalytic domain family protein [Chromobacterium amazonense]